jgi:hypothetical protein
MEASSILHGFWSGFIWSGFRHVGGQERLLQPFASNSLLFLRSHVETFQIPLSIYEITLVWSGEPQYCCDECLKILGEHMPGHWIYVLVLK